MAVRAMYGHSLKGKEMENGLILCPVCRHEFTHHDEIVIYDRLGGEDGTTLAFHSKDGTWKPSEHNPSRRRDAVEIKFYGECGHEWSVEFIQHKGQTLVNTRIPTVTE